PRDTYHGGASGNRLGNDRVRTDLRVLAHLKRAQNFGPRPNDDTVMQRRMALSFIPTGTTQGDALIQSHVITDFGRFTNHHAHSVVNEKASPDARTRMNLDTGQPATNRRQK